MGIMLALYKVRQLGIKTLTVIVGNTINTALPVLPYDFLHSLVWPFFPQLMR